jgi:two-component system cell cycle response regulator
VDKSLRELTEELVDRKPYKLLIIDDNPDMHVVIRALLKRYMPNILLSTALSGEEGIKIATTNSPHSPDVILLDIKMPGMDGFETAKRLLADHRTHHIPVIMMSGMEKEATEQDLPFLPKPFTSIELVAKLKEVLCAAVLLLGGVTNV